MECEKVIYGGKCGGQLQPNTYTDEITKRRMVSGLTCNLCGGNVVTSEMTMDEWHGVLYEANKAEREKVNE